MIEVSTTSRGSTGGSSSTVPRSTLRIAERKVKIEKRFEITLEVYWHDMKCIQLTSLSKLCTFQSSSMLNRPLLTARYMKILSLDLHVYSAALADDGLVSSEGE